ncbi:thermonuclease family protein [Pelagibacteraceae bacterium]|jgi:endonuclease YncB( thermonuclease family)|nr:thermonuclease family protein [Pelagibacteraceae bacterium]
MTFCKFLFLSILLSTSSAFSQEKIYVIDGDTIHIGSNKYRFSGIDTPEMKQTCSKDNKIIMCGVLAKNALIKKISNRPVLCKEETIDRYKRIIAECFINNDSLSKYLVRNGHAFAYRKYSKKFIEDEQYAKENKLGLWSMTFEYPWEYRRKLRSK